MAEGRTRQLFQDSLFHNGGHTKDNEDYEKYTPSSSFSSTDEEDSTISNGSSISSFDPVDDASTSISSSVSSNSNGALYDLSEIMAQLPIKRGLSKYYQGKSESFTSLSSVTCIEDLAKKTTPYRKKMNASKSCANGLNSFKSYTLPKPIISKKAAKSSLSSFSSKRGSCMSHTAHFNEEVKSQRS